MAQISVNNLTFSYEGSYDNIFENVSFSVDHFFFTKLCDCQGEYQAKHQYRTGQERKIRKRSTGGFCCKVMK